MLISEKVYPWLPIALQNISCSAYGWRERRIRMGDEFWNKYNWLLQTERANRSEILAYKDEQVSLLIKHAYNTVPYYKKVMSEYGLKPTDIISVQDLKKMPILNKEDVIANQDSMISTVYSPKQLVKSKTSGTTGKALSFFNTYKSIPFQWAVWWRHRARFGIAPFTRHLNFTGKVIAPVAQVKPPYWRWNWPMNQALINMQHISPQKIKSIVSFVNKNGFHFYSGYPSIIHQFSELIKENNLELSHQPEFIFLGAENVYDFQRVIIEEITGAKVTDQYGLSEGCANASRCEHDIYHEDWEFSVLECEKPEILDDGTVRGEIIATGFANYGFPFIRYAVGDTAIWAEDSFNCSCGRESRALLKIEGRNEDYVVTPEGTRIMRFDYLFKDTKGIKEAQVIQNKKGAVRFLIVPRSTYSLEEEVTIRNRVRNWISPKMDVDIELVDTIPRSKSGKFKPVVSELNEIITKN